MRISSVLSLTTVCFLAFACGNQDTTPQPATPQGQQAYPQQQPQQPQAYPQQTPPQQQQTYSPQQGAPSQQPSPQPQAAPPQATPQPSSSASPAAPMATPGPLALPCQNDQACGLARCNVKFQKCAFPCQGPADCSATASCNPMTGLCLPGGH